MLKIDKVHSMDEYLDLLKGSSTIYIDRAKLEDALYEARYLCDDFKRLTSLQMSIESSGLYYTVVPINILDMLYDLGVDVDKYQKRTKTKNMSLDINNVVDPMIEHGIQPELLGYYKLHRSYKTYAGFLDKLWTSQGKSKVCSDGRVILSYSTNIQERQNLRVYYKDIAVVSIPKRYSEIITTPGDGYHIAWCDYPQADWRFAYNLFIKDPSNVGIMEKVDDAYEGLARIIEKEEFDPEEFKSSRQDYKVNCLSVFYGSHNTHPIPTAMRDYFMSREKYKRYVYELEQLQQFHLPIPCTSYFGYTQLLPESNRSDLFLNKGLNTPIQTFTSHIVNETVFGILERFWNLGYTKDDINIYFVRHDEPLFLFKDTCLKDAWIFEECSKIYIPGFTPIVLNFQFGDNYQCPSEYLENAVKQNIESNRHRITTYADEEGSDSIRDDYTPVPSAESAKITFFKENGKTKVVFYDSWRNESKALYTDKESGMDAIYDVLGDYIVYLNYPSYLLLHVSGISTETTPVEVEEHTTIVKFVF